MDHPSNGPMRLTNTNSTPLREHPRRHIHRTELLEQELRRIRDDDLRDLRLVLARPTLDLAFFQLRNRGHEAAYLADVHAERIADVQETFLEEGDLDGAAREMNGLQGWAKTLSKDWLGEVRRVLEVQQALDVIATEARLQSLRVE